ESASHLLSALCGKPITTDSRTSCISSIPTGGPKMHLPRSSPGPGKRQPEFPADMHHDRNAAIPEGLEGRDGLDRQGDVVEACAPPAGVHLLRCRTSRHGYGHEENACGCRR